MIFTFFESFDEMEYIYNDNYNMKFDNEIFKRTSLRRNLSVTDGNSTNIFSDDDFTLNDFPFSGIIIALAILLIFILCWFSCISYSCIYYCKKSSINENIVDPRIGNQNNTIV